MEETSETEIKTIFQHFSGTLRIWTAPTRPPPRMRHLPTPLASSSSLKEPEEKEEIQPPEHITPRGNYLTDHSAPSFASIRSIASDDPPSAYKMTTPLHLSCGSTSPSIPEMKALLEARPRDAMIRDASGDLPLHIFAENEKALGGRDQATDFANALLRAYPASIVVLNDAGRIPFTDAVLSWVDAVHEEEKEEVMEDEGEDLRLRRPSRVAGDQHIYSAVIPKRVSVPPLVDWCLHMLSLSMDGVFTASRSSFLSEHRRVSIRGDVADNVASIPNFIKTILLIQDDDVRNYIVQSSLFQRVLLCPESVGMWVISLLRAKGQYATRCVDYFEYISDPSAIRHFLGPQKNPTQTDITRFDANRMELFGEVGGMQSLIPSLVVLPEGEIERAAVTSVIQLLLDKAISQPFFISSTVIDIIFHIFLLFIFRSLTYQTGIIVKFGEDADSHPNTEFPTRTLLITTSYLICFHALFRRMSQSISMLAISPKIFWKNWYNFWNVLHFITIVLVIASVAVMMDPGTNPTVLSFTMGLLWLSLIFYLKAVNKRLAFLIFAVQQIFKDLLWFLCLFAMGIFAFADMGHIITTSSGVDCIIYKNETMALDYDDITQIFCSDNIRDTYFAAYSILMGNFTMEFLSAKPAFSVLFLAFSVLAILLLLNCLTAIVIESYEKSKYMAARIFARARVEFAAEQISLGNHLRRFQGKKLCVRRREGDRPDNETYINFLGVIYRYCVLFEAIFMTIALLALQIQILMVHQTQEKYAGLIGNNAVCIVFFCLQSTIVVFCVLTIIDTSLIGLVEPGTFIFQCRDGLSSCYKKTIVPIAHLLSFDLLSEQSYSIKNKAKNNNDWAGRIAHLERVTNRIVAEECSKVAEVMKGTEERILYHGDIMKEEIEALLESWNKAKIEVPHAKTNEKTDEDSHGTTTSDSMREFKRQDLDLGYSER